MKIRKLVYKFLSDWDKILGNKNNVFILCYHDIEGIGRFSTKVTEFEKQVKSLSKTHQPVSLSFLVEQIKNKKIENQKVFVICFDDGYKNILKVENICKKYGIKPTVNLIEGKENISNVVNNKFLSISDIAKLQTNGWEFGNHTKSHQILTNLSEVELKKELTSKSKVIAFPLGRYNKNIVTQCRKLGYEIGLTMDDGFINNNSDLMTLPRIGVDNTHDFGEFKTLMSPSVIGFRKFLKNSLIKNLFIKI